MTFALQPGEPVGEGLRRCAVEELEDAVASLRGLAGAGDADVTGVVHEARKSCKKVRALLRVAREALGKDLRKAENAALREAAGLLSPARDIEVLASLLADLEDESDAPSGLGAAVAVLRERADGMARVVQAGDSAAAAARVGDVLGRARTWPLDGDVEELLGEGLRKVAEQERSRRDAALAAGLHPDDGGPERVDELRHDWRKRAKDLWYVARLLAEVSEPAAQAVDRFDALGNALGEDHDAAVLERHLRAAPGASGTSAALHVALPDAPDREQLAILLRRRREPLVQQAQALALGRPHAADPDALVDAWLAPLRRPA